MSLVVALCPSISLFPFFYLIPLVISFEMKINAQLRHRHSDHAVVVSSVQCPVSVVAVCPLLLFTIHSHWVIEVVAVAVALIVSCILRRASSYSCREKDQWQCVISGEGERKRERERKEVVSTHMCVSVTCDEDHLSRSQSSGWSP